MTRSPFIMRAAALLSGGAYAVHQLRYELGFGESAGKVLSEHGHGYLAVVAPLVSLLLAAMLGQVLWAVTRRTTPRGSGLPLARLWLLASSALVVLYTGQEWLEGWLAPGHPAGLSGVFGDGGWTAVPLALVAGAAVAVALRVARAVDQAPPPAVLPAVRALVPALPDATRVVPDAPRAAASPLALRRAGRAPPSDR